MPLRDDILNPISEANPGGENLRYAPVYDKIKEARRQDDDLAQGDWQIERKVADYPLVIKLATEAIATKSKDLQLAAWLTEALLNTQGYAGLSDGLTLIKAIVENFWDTCWPEVEEGDTEMRSAPIDWVGQYLAISAKRVPLIKGGHDYLKYIEAKAVGTEPEYEASESKKEAYAAAVAEGKMSYEEFDKLLIQTPKQNLDSVVGSIDACLQTMEESQGLFEEKFADYPPSYSKLKESLEEVRRVVRGWVQKKAETETAVAEPEPQAEAVPEQPADDGWGDWSTTSETTTSEPEVAAEAPKPKAARKVTSVEPADKEDAGARVAAAAAFWRREDPYSPAPYLMLRGMRWGEIRAASSLDPNLFEAPPTEVRTTLKRLLNEGSYAEMIEVAENAMAEPCGRAWLDLQRYVVTALDYQGYSAVSEAIKSELKALVRDYPDLLTSTLLDDTPTANNETLKWINEFAAAAEPVPQPVSWSAPPPELEPEPGADAPAAEDAPPDAFQLAMDAVRNGRPEEAIEILADEVSRQTSGRGRFQRTLQLAQVCLGAGHETIAQSLLEELESAIDRHRLEEWESPDTVAHALSLLYSCVAKSDIDPVTRSKLYARVCRLSPMQALRHGSQALAQGR